MGANDKTMTVQELRDLRLGKLGTAVTDWRAMVKKLRVLATGEGGGGKEDVTAKGLYSAATGGLWKGQNALVTQEFVRKTANEFQDVLAEAEDVLGLLDSSHKAFTKHKENLEQAVADAVKKGVYITDGGEAIETRPSPQAMGKGGDTSVLTRPTQADLDGAETAVKRVLWDASEDDRIVARELRKIAKRKHDFSGGAESSVRAADKRQGEADAAYWLKKLDKYGDHPEKMSQKELEKFNEVLRNQRDNSGFTTTFAQVKGADGTLQLWRSLADPGRGETPEGERAKLLGHIQDNLGMSLANATRQNTPGMQAWEDDMIKAGSKEFGVPGTMNKAYGFQVMSALMNKGTFDKGFLDRYGNALMKHERDHRSAPEAWGLMMPGTDLDHSTADSRGNDPMTGYLKALSHNPDASTAVFNDDDKADYLLRERAFYDEDKLDSDGADADVKLPSREALGDALFAAGSGMNPDDPAAEYVEHQPEHKQVVDGALRRLAAEGDEMPASIRDDMAKLLGNHGTETHMTMGSVGKGEQPFERADLLEVTKQISHDKHSYQVLNESLNGAMVNDIHEHTESTADSTPKDSLSRTGRSVGFLEAARNAALKDMSDQEIKDAGWGAKGMGGYLAVATGSSFLPWGGGHVANAAFAVSKALVEDETAQIGQEAISDSQDAHKYQQHRLEALKNEWVATNPEFAREENLSSDQGALDEYDQAAQAGAGSVWGELGLNAR